MASRPAARAATTERVVIDHNSGLAISGFDPVAYFVDKAAMPGNERFEHTFAGAVWRFRNAGNWAAFIADPDVYAPWFGGYDPIDIARGVAVAGNARLWLVTGERLYLFSLPEDKNDFSGDAERRIAAAEKRWPQVQAALSP